MVVVVKEGGDEKRGVQLMRYSLPVLYSVPGRHWQLQKLRHRHLSFGM